MLNSTESRLWLAVHLLYPNAAQAFDVYQAVVLQSEEALEGNANPAVFAKLVQAFEKIPPISSNLSFYEFEFDQIDQWKAIYKNSQKNQLLMFVGVLIFDLRLAEIAPFVKLTADKAQFLFHQIFKKLAQSSSKLKYSEPLNFKKQNDTKISYLFTYENLVDYCLGQLPPEEHEKVKTGLELYPVLQATKDEYAKIISQIQNLKVQKNERPAAVKKADAPKKTESAEERLPFAVHRKMLVAGLGVLVAVVLVSIGIFQHLQSGKKSLVIQQVDKKPEVAAAVSAEVATSVPPESMAASEEPVAFVAEAKPGPVPAPPPVKPGPVKAENKPAKPVKQVQEAQAEGGLYRGTLLVKNLAGINERIQKKMEALGARKAGEVELGWMKSPSLAYYHYIIPEEKIEEAAAFYKQFGTLNVKFEKHPRSVPGGHRRFIIEIMEK